MSSLKSKKRLFHTPIKINTSITSFADDKAVAEPLTPHSPESPVSPAISPNKSPLTPLSIGNANMNKKAYSVKSVIKGEGYVPIKNFAQTLQGSIWKVCDRLNQENLHVIKVTKRLLHDNAVTYINGKAINISENIITETAILRYLTANKAPDALAKYQDFFCDSTNYYLVMEDGGSDFFEFIAKCHRFIANGTLEIREWQRFCRIAMRQMVELLEWMHNAMNCCHLDLSLENFVIDNVMVMMEPISKKISFSDNFQIKLCDFGLAEVFTAKNKMGEIDFRCQKYVGKTAYKSPEVYRKKQIFDARTADCWSLGVVFFMMVIGGAPFAKPSMSDASYQFIATGKLIELLEGWNRINYVSSKMLDLMLRLFRPEKYRLTIKQIKNHPWLL